MNATMIKGLAVALLVSAMGMSGTASAAGYPGTPCNSSNAWEEVTLPIRPYDGWDSVTYTCVPGYGWYLSSHCNSSTGVCFYY